MCPELLCIGLMEKLPFATLRHIGHRLPPFATVRHRLSPFATVRPPSPFFATVCHPSPPFGAVLLRRSLHLPSVLLSPPSFSARITLSYEQKSCFQVAHFLFHRRRWTIPSNHKKTSFFMMFCLRFVLSLHCKKSPSHQKS